MLKKVLPLFLVFSLVFAVSAPLLDHADARGKYRSPSRSFNPTAPKNDVQRTTPQRNDQVNSGTNTPGSAVNRPGANTGAGGFLGGGLMRGLFLGGMAGLLFGGLLANFGALGSFFGLLINLIAIYVLFVIVKKVIQYFIHRNNERRKIGP